MDSQAFAKFCLHSYESMRLVVRMRMGVVSYLGHAKFQSYLGRLYRVFA